MGPAILCIQHDLLNLPQFLVFMQEQRKARMKSNYASIPRQNRLDAECSSVILKQKAQAEVLSLISRCQTLQARPFDKQRNPSSPDSAQRL